MVKAAAALLTPHRTPDRQVTPAVSRRLTASAAKSVELHGNDPRLSEVAPLFDGLGRRLPRGGEPFALASFDSGRVAVEGPRSYITVAPGVLRLSTFDPIRAERSHEAQERRHRIDSHLMAQEILAGDGDQVDDVDAPTRGSILTWSRKSRANMVRVLSSLDYSGMYAAAAVPAMVTLTYPGDWLAVAPHAAASRRHLKLLVRRFARQYGRPLVGVWKREFQRRGAPHFHILMVPPTEVVNGEGFQAWLARTWVEIVAPSRACACDFQGVGIPSEKKCKWAAEPEGCPFSEWNNMMRVHLGPRVVDFAEGMRQSDPKRVGVYFAKHGAYAAKEYQNEAPSEWAEAGSVGRFWGVWGLVKVLATVEVTDAERVAAARTLRRWYRQSGYVAPVPVWRYSDARRLVDDETGAEVRSGWHKRKVRRRVKRMRGSSGFVTLNDAPAFVSQLARYLDQVHLHRTGELRG